jgi:hypothetical protein
MSYLYMPPCSSGAVRLAEFMPGFDWLGVALVLNKFEGPLSRQ